MEIFKELKLVHHNKGPAKIFKKSLNDSIKIFKSFTTVSLKSFNQLGRVSGVLSQ